MPVAGSLSLILGATTGPLEKGLAKARALVGQYVGSSAKAFDNKSLEGWAGKMQAEAQRIAESTKTPTERFRQEQQKLKALRAAGLIDAQQYSRAQKKLNEDLAAANGPGVGKKLAIGIAAGAATLGAAIAAGLKVALSSYSELEQSSAKLSAALKGNGYAAGVSLGQVRQLGAELAQTTTNSTAATMSQAAALAKFQAVSGSAFTEAIKQAQNWAAVSGQDATAATQALGAALKNPREGYLDLARAGVAFSTAQIDAIQQMQAAGDMAGAQGVILDAMKQQYDGAAEAAGDTLSGKLTILHNTFSDIAAVVGEAVAPALKGGIDLVQGWLGSVDRVAISNKAWELAAWGAGLVADAVHYLKIGYQALQLGFDVMVAGTIEGFALLASGAAKAAQVLADLGVISQATANDARALAKDIDEWAKAGWDNADAGAAALGKSVSEQLPSTKVKKFFDDMKSDAKDAAGEMKKAIVDGPAAAMKQLTAREIEAQSEATKLIQSLQTDLKSFGMDDWQKKAADLKEKGATPAQVEQVKKLGAQLKGKELAQSLETPLEKFEREMKKLKELHDAGGIDTATFQRAQGALVKDLQAAVPQVKASAGGAMLAGTAEARSAVLAYRNAGQNNNPMDAIRRLQETANEQLRQQTQYLGQISKGLSAPAAAAAGI
ncbi:MAG: phage tail length tape measure family protein [Planctomycetes bacterium]|nr:phage tail length tape measure family protein [Planctomycetota bacterium]